ncbi:RtcB family protein [Candidatus Pacearchaeota archaeon]|nr:RtcB family protein [Candidatus Pacearchaeota archaeon]
MSNENVHILPKEKNMLVPGVVFASPKLFEKIEKDATLEQVKNVAQLPGIVEKSIAMPDAHQGYGFSVGGVAAFDLEKGIISPGGIGFDINCGVRLLRTNLEKKEFLKKREQILSEMYKQIPSGVGRGSEFKLGDKELGEVLEKGVRWAVENGYANSNDENHIEDKGCIHGANPRNVSQRAKARGKNQLGSIGAGNHFLEVQFVEEIFDEKIADTFSLSKNQVVVLIHTGSRGLGHQVASDYIRAMEKEFGWENLPDRQLACAPINSKLGKEYLSAMAAAANFAFVNRQLITHKVRQSFEKYFSKVKIEVVYDIAHNIAKFEEFSVNGRKQTLCVHRKGATRSFGKGRKEIPQDYREVGCPVFIPGSMGTSSYVLVGTNDARDVSFASTAHGAGRVLSRTSAKKNLSLAEVKSKLKERDILIKAGSEKGILEEAPEAYKDVDEVVRVSDELGLGKKVAKLRPMGVVKG